MRRHIDLNALDPIPLLGEMVRPDPKPLPEEHAALKRWREHQQFERGDHKPPADRMPDAQPISRWTEADRALVRQRREREQQHNLSDSLRGMGVCFQYPITITSLCGLAGDFRNDGLADVKL